MAKARQLGAEGQERSPVRLKIERLVLHGFAPADRRSIADGLQAELARLMTDRHAMGSLRKPLALERGDGGTIRIGAGAGPRATARQIAQAIYRSLPKSTAHGEDGTPMRTGAPGREGRP